MVALRNGEKWQTHVVEALCWHLKWRKFTTSVISVKLTSYLLCVHTCSTVHRRVKSQQ